MASIPYMPLYIADYMADAAHLSTLEHGAYMLLIMTYWQRGKPLPNSDERLANVARMSNEHWAQVKPMLQEFFVDDGNLWRHKRIDAELSRFRDKSAKASAAGKASAERRLNKRPTDAQRTPNHTDTDTDLSEGKEPSESKGRASKRKPKVSLAELGVHHVSDWLAQKRAEGRYVRHDEHFVLEQFKNYCMSKGKEYADFVAGYRNAFEWERCQPKDAGKYTKDERARASVLKAATAGGYGPGQRFGGSTAIGDAVVPGVSRDENLWERTGES